MQELQSTTPSRAEIDKADQWDLTKLYPGDEAWLEDVSILEELMVTAASFRGTLGLSAKSLFDGLEFLNQTRILTEKLTYYAFLRLSVDTNNSKNQDKQSRMAQVEGEVNAALSFFEHEVQGISRKTIAKYFSELPELEVYRIMIEKLQRIQPHTLNDKEEKLLALYTESAGTAGKAFSMLVNADMDFGMIETSSGKKRLSRQNLSWFLIQKDRDLRYRAYKQYYEEFGRHKNTLTSLYKGSVQKDIYLAQIRKFPSARASVLFENNIPERVYDNLISSVHEGLTVFQDFFKLRKELLDVDKLRPYDLTVPLIQTVPVDYPYEKAVEIVSAALEPFGREYTETLRHGLLHGWVDRYENRGKQAGAFTAACYSGEPYILLNYKHNVLRNLFTLAHESGHAMHSLYSIRNNPFQHYEYSILEAETAANVHERLLYDYILRQAEEKTLKAFLLERFLNDITAKIFRQTLLAEYEHRIHTEAEAGRPITTEMLRDIYRELIDLYYGSELVLEEESDLEGLTIPHFYQAYYVYTYSVGASAALTLSQGLISEKENGVSKYVDFLGSGGSEYPVDALMKAGVDILSSDSIYAATSEFSSLLEQFKNLLA